MTSFDVRTLGEDTEDAVLLVVPALSTTSSILATDTSTTSTDESESISGSSDDIEAIDTAFAELDADPFDEALLEDLAVTLVG